MPRSTANRDDLRQRIAHLAGRLMAEDGVLDYGAAKRKAARQLGIEDARSLPGNDEVEQALRDYQSLFHRDTQPRELRRLRQHAAELFRLFARFTPRLTGPVLSGTATRHNPIQLHLFAGDSKEVELFLIDRGMDYLPGERSFRYGDAYRTMPAFILRGDPEVELAIFSADDIRQAPRDPVDGRAMRRADLAELEALIEQEA